MQMFGSRRLKNRIMATVLALAMLAVVIPVGSLAGSVTPESFSADFKSSVEDINAKMNFYRRTAVGIERVTLTNSIAAAEDWGRRFETVGGESYVMAPKNKFDKSAKLENFETRFSAALLNCRKVVLTFRSSDITKAYDSADAGDMISVILTGTGYTVVDTAGVSGSTETPWNDGKQNPTWCTINAKVVGDKLSLRVGLDERMTDDDLSDDVVLAETEIQLQTKGEGYITLSVDGNWVGTRFFRCTRLDANGDPIDWNEGVTEETSKTFEAPLKASYADPAAIDKTVNVYYDQSKSEGGEHKLIRVDSIADNAADEKYGGFYNTTYRNDQNAWPLIETTNRTGYLLNNSTSYVPKLSDGQTEAKLKNFETKFRLLVFNDNNMGVALSFRSDKAGAMLDEAGNGGYANKVTLLFNQAGWSIYDGESLNYCNPAVSDANKWADGKIIDGQLLDVYVKVLGQQLTIKVKANDGSILYDNSSSPYEIKTTGAGYLYWSMLTNWTWAGSLECTRLNGLGDAVDWDDESDNVAERKVFLNNFSDAETIDKGLDVYYDQSTEQLARKFAKVDSIADNAADAKYGLPFETRYTGGTWPLIETTNRTGYLLNNSTSFVPKLSDGVTPAKLENFETTFSPLIFEGDKNMGFAISFRSDKPGVMLDDKGQEGYSNKVTLFMNNQGWQIYDGTAMSYAYPNVNLWPSELTGSPTVDIYLRVVGDQMIFKASIGSEVLYDNTDDPYTLETSGPGYIYYSYVTNWSFISSALICKRLDSNGELMDWDAQHEGKVTITEVSYQKELTFDRSKKENYRLPRFVTGTDAEGFAYSIPVVWENSEYRSYQSGKFEFTGKLAATEDYDVSGIADLKLTVNNITDEVMTADGKVASKTWYFDTESDFADFTCRLSSFDLNDSGNDRGSDWHTVTMNQVDTANYWKIENGKAASAYARKLKAEEGTLNGKTRASDATTMLLDKDLTNALINYQIEVDYYGCGTVWRQPFVVFGVQDPSQFFGDVYVNPQYGDKETGSETDLHGNSKGGTGVSIEDRSPWMSGFLQSTGACSSYYYEDFTEGQTTMANYSTRDANKMFIKHTMKITVCGSEVAFQIDDSDRYYTALPDDVSGGYIGFGCWGTSVAFDNLRITALDDLGDPTSYADADKGFAPPDFEDTYTGWKPTAEDIAFAWSDKYYY